jgi:hypothetical protein
MKRRWFLYYYISLGLCWCVTGLNLDGGYHLLIFLVLCIPSRIVASCLTRSSVVIRKPVAGVGLSVVTLVVSFVIVSIYPLRSWILDMVWAALRK